MSIVQALGMELQRRPDWPGTQLAVLPALPSPLPCPATVQLATVNLLWAWEGWSPDVLRKLEQMSIAEQTGAAPLPPVFAGNQF